MTSLLSEGDSSVCN